MKLEKLINTASNIGINVKRFQIGYPQTWQKQLKEAVEGYYRDKKDLEKLNASIDKSNPVSIHVEEGITEFGFLKDIEFNPDSGRISATVWNVNRKAYQILPIYHLMPCDKAQ